MTPPLIQRTNLPSGTGRLSVEGIQPAWPTWQMVSQFVGRVELVLVGTGLKRSAVRHPNQEIPVVSDTMCDRCRRKRTLDEHAGVGQHSGQQRRRPEWIPAVVIEPSAGDRWLVLHPRASLMTRQRMCAGRQRLAEHRNVHLIPHGLAVLSDDRHVSDLAFQYSVPRVVDRDRGVRISEATRTGRTIAGWLGTVHFCIY